MEFIFTDIDIESFVFANTAQAEVEGELPLPEGRRAADSEVLCADGSVAVTRCTAAEGALVVEGRVRAELVCRDVSAVPEEGGGAADTVFAFGTSAAFRYTMDAPGVAEGMRASARAAVVSMNVAQGARLAFSATVEISGFVSSEKPVRALGEVRNAGNGEKAEFLCVPLSCVSVRDIGAVETRLREEAAARGVKRALCAHAACQTRSVRLGGDTAVIEGTAYACALIEDERGLLDTFQYQFPFTLEAALDARPSGEVCADVDVIACDAYVSGDNTLCFELTLCARVKEYVLRETSVPADAYVPVIGASGSGRGKRTSLDASLTTTRALLRSGRVVAPVRIDEPLDVPEGMPKPERAVWCAARPLVTGCAASGDEAMLEGVMNLRVVYETGGAFYSFTTALPFGCAAKCEGEADMAVAGVHLLTGAVTLSGGAFMFSAAAEAVFLPYSVNELDIVTGMEEGPERASKRALLLCYAGEGETLFEIGRAHGVSREALRLSNPGVEETLTEGQPLIFIGY